MIIDNVNKQYEPEGNLSEPVVPQSVPLIYNGKPSNTKQYVHQYLLNKGLPNHISKGIVGNLEQESNLKTNAVNPKSGAYGLAQWLGDRKKNLFKTYGNNPTLENQLDYIVKELNTTEKKAKDKLFESKDVDEATLNFANHYERMGKNEANYKKRISNARSIYKYGGVLKKYELGGEFYDSVGQLSSNLVDSTQSKKARDYKKVSTGTWSGVLSGMGSGASIGSSAGLIGTIAGGVIGGIVGGFSGNKKAKEYNENLNNEFKNENQMFLQNAGLRSKYVLNQYPTKGIDSFYRYKKGGVLNPQYEVEKGEVVQGNAKLEESKELANNLHLVKGKTHEEGGVKGEGGDRVFSNSIGLGNETFADLAKKIANKIKKVENNNSKSAITRQTKQINLKKLNSELDNIFQIQEMIKPSPNQKSFFKKGGLIGTQKVANYQKMLNEKYGAGLIEDGVWGNETEKAYKKHILKTNEDTPISRTEVSNKGFYNINENTKDTLYHNGIIKPIIKKIENNNIKFIVNTNDVQKSIQKPVENNNVKSIQKLISKPIIDINKIDNTYVQKTTKDQYKLKLKGIKSSIEEKKPIDNITTFDKIKLAISNPQSLIDNIQNQFDKGNEKSNIKSKPIVLKQNKNITKAKVNNPTFDYNYESDIRTPYRTKNSYHAPFSIDLSDNKIEKFDLVDAQTFQKAKNHNELSNSRGIVINTFNSFENITDNEADVINLKPDGTIDIGKRKQFNDGSFSKINKIPIDLTDVDYIYDNDDKNYKLYDKKTKSEIPIYASQKRNNINEVNDYGKYLGGKHILVSGNKKILINGSARDFKIAIDRLKAETGKSVELYQLDNGAYNLPFMKSDGKLTKEDIISHRNRHLTSGGVGLSLRKYKYGGYLPKYNKGGSVPKTSKIMADEKIIRERLNVIDNKLKGTFSNPDIKDGLLRESKSLKLRLANVQRQLSSRLNNMSDNSMRNIKASSGNKPSTTIPQSGKENLKQNAKTITNIASNVSKFGNYLKGFGGLSVINEAAQKGAKEVTLSNMMFDNSEIGKKYQQQFSKLNHFQNNDDTVNKIIEDYKNEVKMSSNKKPVKTQERVPSNPIDLTPNRNDIKPSKPLTTTQKYKTVKLQSKAPVLKTPELPKITKPILPTTGTNVNKTLERTDNPFKMERDSNGIPTISKSYMDSISSNSQPAIPIVKEPKQGFDFSKITPYIASVANYLGNKNMINSLQEEVPVNLNQATPYNYYDRSNMIRTQLGKSFSSLMTNPYISQGNKQNMYANYLDKLGEVEDNERLGKLQYDANYADRNYQVEASNNATLQNAKIQQIANKNQKIGLNYQNTNDLYSNVVGEQNARKRDEQILKIYADANPNTGHAYYNYLKKLYNIS